MPWTGVLPEGMGEDRLTDLKEKEIKPTLFLQADPRIPRFYRNLAKRSNKEIGTLRATVSLLSKG